MIIGRNVGIHFVTEGTYGTNPGSVTGVIGKVENFSVSMNNNFAPHIGLGAGRDVVNYTYGSFDCSGTITWKVHDFTFLQYAIGVLSGDGAADGTAWTLTEANEYGTGGSAINSFSMAVGKNDGSSDVEDTYTGCILSQVTLNAAEGGVLMATANFFAQSVSTDTAIATSYTQTTVNPWVNAQSTIKWGATPTALAKVVNWSLTINNNPIIYRDITSRFIVQPVAGKRVYTFTIAIRASQAILATLTSDLYGDSSDPYTPTTAVTTASPTADLELELKFAEGAGAGDRKGTITLDQGILNDNSDPITINDEVSQQTFNGQSKTGKGNVFCTWVD